MQFDSSVALAAIAGVFAVWLFRRWREIPPLKTNPDDPLLLAAYARARASTAEFLLLARQSKEPALVKLRFVTSSNQVEHLWAEVLEVASDAELRVLLVTPPVSHLGVLDRERRLQVADIEDWQIRDSTGKIRGGFSQRAMFAIARRDGVKLPRSVMRTEADYQED
jgi:uncharacterized protein YegJ (DUF2314 family)